MKPNFTLLKRLVAELESASDHADDEIKDKDSHIVALSKAMGLAMSASHEATMLVSDFQLEISKSQGLDSDKLTQVLKEFGKFSGSKN